MQAFILSAIKYKLGSSPADMKKLMGNTCLIGAILKQHIIPGVFTTEQLRQIYSKPSLLITQNARGELTISSASVDPATKRPNIMGSLTGAKNIRAGSGIVHNINQLMLPTTNITRLLQITNCTLSTNLPLQ
eukprot:gene6740-6960_t